MKQFCFVIIVLLTHTIHAREHNPILPQPQQISYGQNRFMLAGASISIGTNPSSEDKFAASELARILSGAGAGKISMTQQSAAGRTIIFKRIGKNDPLPMPGEKPAKGSREYYTISVRKTGITVTAVSSAGLFYAVQTLRQMIEGSGKNAYIPECSIEDWPSMAYRGFMMDMSHMQFPKMEEIKSQIDFLSRFKTNQYFFYSEASIELDGYPLLMANARFSKQEIREIIAYARDRHIDVVPNMELYGHLHDLFKLEHYADLSVNPYGGEFRARDPRVKQIINDWITQISSLFPSPFFHIGFDETWVIDLEAKKLKQTPDQLYLEMLNQTTDMVEKNGKQALVWADMLQKYHNIIPKLSPKLNAVAWHYFPLSSGQYDTLLSPFANAGIPLTVQSASINWHWFYPAFEISFKNNDLLIEAARKYKAVGYINSGWTDDPQTLIRLSRPDMAHGSIASWQSAPVDQQLFFDKYASTLYPAYLHNDSLAINITKAHNALRESESFIRKAVGQTDEALWENAFTEKSLALYKLHQDDLHKGRLLAEKAQVYLREALKKGVDTITLFAMLTGAKELDLLAMKYLFAGDIAALHNKYQQRRDTKEFRMLMGEVTAYYHSKIVDMFDAITETKEMFQKAWLNEYTSFRLGVAMAKFDMELQYWMMVRLKLDTLKWNYKDDQPFPSLNEILRFE